MSDLVELLREGRRREGLQALFYRALSGQAEDAGDPVAAERLNELLADEQHHVSRLTARLLELGEEVERGRLPAPRADLEGWEEEARGREADEVAWYESAAEVVDDAPTREILREILASERHHRENLAGKWMSASPPSKDRASEDREER